MAIDIPDLDYTADPTAEHVEVFIRGANWWPTDADQIAVAQSQAAINIAAAIKRFKKLVRWEPFIADASASARYFDTVNSEGRILLGDGLLSLTSLTISGTAYTLNSNVFLEPANAPSKGRPYTYLQLWSANRYSTWEARPLRPRSIVVTGRWGYTTQWPADAYEAIISRAAAMTLGAVNQEQELSGISEGPFSEEYDLVGPIDPKTAFREAWGKYFDQVAASYRKPDPGPATMSVGSHTAGTGYNHFLPTA